MAAPKNQQEASRHAYEFVHGHNEGPALLDVKAVAALFQASPSTIWRRVNDGTMPRPVRIGGMTRWARDEIDAVIDRAKRARDEAGAA